MSATAPTARARPVIGITTYGRNEENHFVLPSEYVDAVRRAGGTPVLLPPGESAIEEWLAIVDGIILAGGGDLSPEHYAGDSHEAIYMVDSERDSVELGLARRVIESGHPTLGICRGTQILNVALGGTLHAHLPDVVGDSVSHRLPPREPTSHSIDIVANSTAASVFGCTTFQAASWHHQAIARVGKGLAVVAHAPDGTIEAIEMDSHRWLLGVQWHPELTAEVDAVQQRVFDVLVEVSRDQQSEGTSCV